MLRLKVLASVVPLAVAALFARGELLAGPRPCIEISGTSVQIATLSWQAHRHVSFTSDPGRATVRVQISETAEAADREKSFGEMREDLVTQLKRLGAEVKGRRSETAADAR